MNNSAVAPLQRKVCIFENERYTPLIGWSSRGLLPTDPGTFCSIDSSEDFETLEEASSAMISHGWQYESDEWILDKNSDNTDDEGWSYMIDFTGFESHRGYPSKQMLNFVRRKMWYKFASFDINSIFDCEKLTCNTCDLEEVDRVCRLLLDTLTQLSLHLHPRSISRGKIHALKSSIISCLHLHGQSIENIDSTEGSILSSKFTYSFESIQERLQTLYLQEKQNQNNQRGWSLISAIEGFLPPEGSMTRELDISPEFSLQERTELAKLIIRKYDHEYVYHCNVSQCGDRCDFAPMSCGNLGCGVIFSRKWESKHDAICGHKIVSCERFCGETLKRLSMADHLQLYCELRPIRCPFAELGCVCDVVVRTLPKHIETNVHQHLSLTLQRLQEHEGVIKGMNKKVNELEYQSNIHGVQITQLQGGVTSVMAMECAEMKQHQSLHEEIAHIEKNSNKKYNELHAQMDSEIARLKRTVSDLQRTK